MLELVRERTTALVVQCDKVVYVSASEGEDYCTHTHTHTHTHSRPATSFLWFTSPWKTFKYIIWRHNKWRIIGVFVFILLVVIIIIFICTLPVSQACHLHATSM